MRRTANANRSLRQIPGLTGVKDAELARLALAVDECSVPEGTVLVREGTVARASYVIVDGRAEVAIGGTPVAAVGPGDHVGEMALLDGQPRSATVTAKTDMRVLVIGPSAIGTFLDQPSVVRAIAAGLASRLRAADAATTAAR